MTIYDTMRKTGPALVSKFANENTIAHERPTKTPDGAGGSTVVWANVGTYSGAVLPVSGGETLQLQRNNIEATHAVYLNPTDGAAVQNGDRFVFRSRVFNVTWVKNIGEADAAYMVACTEGAGA